MFEENLKGDLPLYTLNNRRQENPRLYLPPSTVHTFTVWRTCTSGFIAAPTWFKINHTQDSSFCGGEPNKAVVVALRRTCDIFYLHVFSFFHHKTLMSAHFKWIWSKRVPALKEGHFCLKIWIFLINSEINIFRILLIVFFFFSLQSKENRKVYSWLVINKESERKHMSAAISLLVVRIWINKILSDGDLAFLTTFNIFYANLCVFSFLFFFAKETADISMEEVNLTWCSWTAWTVEWNRLPGSSAHSWFIYFPD